MAKRHRRKKPQKPVSRMGIWASGLALFSFIICLLVTAVAATTDEQIPGWALFLAMLAMLENFFGVFLGFREVKDEDLALGFRLSGLISTLFMSVVWIFYFILGFFA